MAKDYVCDYHCPPKIVVIQYPTPPHLSKRAKKAVWKKAFKRLLNSPESKPK